MKEYTCGKCHKELDSAEAYEYRGVFSCEGCFDDIIEARDYQRQGIINEEDTKLNRLKGLDLSDGIIGKANRKLLKTSIEISSKESIRLKEYEGRG